jgi:hypothetical protein
MCSSMPCKEEIFHIGAQIMISKMKVTHVRITSMIPEKPEKHTFCLLGEGDLINYQIQIQFKETITIKKPTGRSLQIN